MPKKKSPKDKIKLHANRILNNDEINLLIDEDFSEIVDENIQETIDSHINNLESQIKQKLDKNDTKSIQTNLDNFENTIIEKVLDDSKLESSHDKNKIIEIINTKKQSQDTKNQHLRNQKLDIVGADNGTNKEKNIDGSFEVNITENKISATLTCRPPSGKGKAVTTDDVMKQIQQLGISYGIKVKEIEKHIEQVNKNKPCENITIVQGRSSQNGKDAVIELNENFADPATIPGLTKLKGKVCILEASDILLAYEEPKRGVTGIDIFNNKIPCQDGKGTIEVGANIVQQRIDNKTQFVMNISGIAHFDDNKLQVHESYDSKFEIIVSQDKMQAFLKLKKSKGIGKKLNIDDIKQAFSDKGIVVIVNMNLIKKSVEMLNAPKSVKIHSELKKTFNMGKDGQIMFLVAQGTLPGQSKETEFGYDIFKNTIKGDIDGSFEINISDDKFKSHYVM